MPSEIPGIRCIKLKYLRYSGVFVSLFSKSGKCFGDSSLHIMPFWILFENVMSMYRMKAAIIGLLETANFNEWVVTEKLGETLTGKLEISFSEPTRSSLRDK